MSSDATAAPLVRGRQRIAAWDATTFLTWWLTLLVAVPSRLTFAPLGAVGTPAQLLGMAGGFWWLWHRAAAPRSTVPRQHPVRRAMLFFAASVLASFVAAMTRPIDDVELSSAQMGVLGLTSWLGVLLVAHDGLSSIERLDTLLSRVAVAAGCLAAFALLQFVTGRPLTNYIEIPGLSENLPLLGLAVRDGFVRPAGTARSPIEFGVFITMALPLALHVALHGNGAWFRRWGPVAAIAVAIPISISRSAIIGTVMVLCFLAPTWTATMRRAAGVAGVGLLAGIFVLVPGMLGAIVGLFTGISGDESALSRTGSYPLAWEFFTRAPLFGRGLLTFLPKYRILDNQYLGLLIDTGAAGVVTLLILFAAGVGTAFWVRRSTSEPTRALALSLAASITAGAAGFAFFDALSFPMVAGMMFLALGCTGALRRLTLDGPLTP